MSRSILDKPLPGMAHLTIKDYLDSALIGHPEGQEMHSNLFGRTLNLDPHSKRVILDVPALNAEEDINRKPLTWPQFKEHQERRERESFELEMRQNKNPDPKLCRTCRTFKTVRENGLTNDTNIQWRPYGNFNQFALRRHCAFCRLVLYLIVCGKSKLHPRLAAIDREVQGVQVFPQRLSSGEWFLAVEYAYRRVGAIRAVREDNYRTVVRQSDDSKADSAVALLYDERVIRGPQRVSTRVMVEWLGNCEHDHGETCNTEPKQSEDIRILLVDVVDKRLVLESSTCRYLALSYVWGGVSMLRTLKSNLQKYSVVASLDPQNPDIPKTISDAMDVVFALGERYLWVDSLCIVQDDTEQKHYYISRMDVIYSKAFATICALSGKDANAGLPGIRPGSRQPQMIEHTATLSLVSTPPTLEYIQDISAWNTRAWTFQEKLLSRRCLHFSDDYVYFQCQAKTLSETDGDLPAVETSEEASIFDTQFIHKYLTPAKHRGDPERWDFEAYKSLVESYTKRKLSYPTDILHAFSGILRALQERFEGRILSGLPAAVLDITLLWVPAQPLSRRQSSPTLTFPSWSWVGWIGPILYRVVPGLGAGDRQLRPEIDLFHTHHHGTRYEVYERRLATGPEQESTSRQLVDHVQTSVSAPDFGPGVLQFWAFVVGSGSFTMDQSPPTYLCSPEHGNAHGMQGVSRLYDCKRQHCGLIFRTHETKFLSGSGCQREFTLVSTYNADGGEHPGLHSVEGAIKLFDHKPFGWSKQDRIVNALLIEWDNDVAERVTVALIHYTAWEEARPQRKYIRLG